MMNENVPDTLVITDVAESVQPTPVHEKISDVDKVVQPPMPHDEVCPQVEGEEPNPHAGEVFHIEHLNPVLEDVDETPSGRIRVDSGKEDTRAARRIRRTASAIRTEGEMQWDKMHTDLLNGLIMGMNISEIAQKYDYPYSKLYRVKNSSIFQDMYAAKLMSVEQKVIKNQYEADPSKNAEIISNVRAIFMSEALNAANKLAFICRKGRGEHRIQLEAAKEILYQIGMKPTQVIETRTRQYSVEEIKSANAIAKETEAIATRLAKAESRFIIKDTATLKETVSSGDNGHLD